MSESRLLAGRVVTRASTSQQVADVIKEQLLLGQASPGTRLSDRIIATELQVSRNTVREAMTILAAEGLVMKNLHKGVVVADLDIEELRDVYQARRALELAGLRAASTADPQWRTALDEALAVMRQAAAADDLRALLDADRSFHEALVLPIGSKRVQAFYRKVQTEIRLTRAWYGAREDSEVFLRRHQRIGDAIGAADYVLAEKLLSDLIDAGEERLRRQLQAPPSTAD
jgi:DNA-binding GntR family transcriptional regulator